ncbi:MAG: type II toxin-antitoxin system HicB family antitoxin [Bacteroidales bacterium]|nr:type II toxin-antitoxin system HicB family antitoxin [Bacteroidales bacterium]
MNTLKYKGYVGSVAYSEPDRVFFGKIEGIDDLVNYEGESVTELTAAFHEAVDDYLAYCEDHGLKPEKSYTGTFNVRISPMTHREIANLASEEGISINAFVKRALLEAVSRGYEGSKSSLVLEPSATYGPRKKVRITIPVADVPLAEELFKRLDWKVEE